MNSNRMIQITSNAIALTLFAAAIGCGRGQNPSAQLALLAGALPISLVGSYHGHLADKADPYQRMRDAAALEAYAGQLAAAIEIPVMPAPMLPAPMLPAASAPMGEPKYFDWQLIQTKPDKYAHLAIVGGTGDGKSTLVQSLLQFLGEKAIAVDPHWQPGNYPGIPTVAKGRNYGEYPANPIPFEQLVRGGDCSYTEAIATIHKEMDRRYKLLQKGQPVGDRYSFILDEYTTFAGTHPKCSKGEVLDLIREARKVELRLILLVQSDLLKDFQWEGQGAARKSLRWCRLGDFATEYAATLKDDFLVQWANSQAYPMFVEKSPAILPVPLSKMQSYCQSEKSNQPVDPISDFDSIPAKNEADIIKNYLNRLYDLPGYAVDRPVSTSNPSDHLGSLDESLGGTQSQREVQPLSDPGDSVTSTVAKEGYPASLLGSRSLVTLIENLKKEGQNQEQIIKLLWGLPKNGKQKYKDAVAEFKRITGEN